MQPQFSNESQRVCIQHPNDVSSRHPNDVSSRHPNDVMVSGQLARHCQIANVMNA